MELSLRARIRAGDHAAFGRLFDENAQVVHRYALRWTGDRSAAEDVVSLTFLEAWRLRERLRPDGESLRPWLLGIATNVLRNLSRSTRRHHNALARLPRQENAPDFSDELVGRLADADRVVATRRALAKLRSTEREVFLLCVWADVDYATAAEALGVAVGTVRSRLSRARTKLRRLVDTELEPTVGDGQVPGGRANAARSSREKSR